MTSSKKQSKKKQQKKREKERKENLSRLVAKEIHKNHLLIHHLFTHSILVTNLKKVEKAIVKRIFFGAINYKTSFNRITDTGA